jgi:hypothetical protein
VVTGEVETTRVVGWVWRVRNRIETTLDADTGRTVMTRTWEDENGRRREREDRYGHGVVESVVGTPGGSRQGTFLPVPPGARDPFTVLLLLRGATLVDDDVMEVPVVSGGRLYQGRIRVVGRETLPGVVGVPTRCVRLRATFTRDGRPSDVRAEIWLTDDGRRLPARVDAVTDYGRLTSRLTVAQDTP